jgi:23S rRNA (cytosine1962-C5)-methyltransferase
VSNYSDAPQLLRLAIERRAELLDRLSRENTDMVRLFHGTTEGALGLTIDRYGGQLLLQTWRDPLELGIISELRAVVNELLGTNLTVVWNHRVRPIDFDKWFIPNGTGPNIGTEAGVRYDARLRHRGQDPLLFLDFRVARATVRAQADGKRVLNSFSYTGGVGVAAALGGATEVWQLDFARSAQDVAKTNAELNNLTTPIRYLQENAITAMRQMAGLSLGRARRIPDLGREQFDLVILDPPRFSKSRTGSVDLVRDYQSLFKPALMCTAEGGHMLVANNVAQVDRESWVSDLSRCAVKAGRPIRDIELLAPDDDFPSFDGRPPLKVALLFV